MVIKIPDPAQQDPRHMGMATDASYSIMEEAGIGRKKRTIMLKQIEATATIAKPVNLIAKISGNCTTDSQDDDASSCKPVQISVSPASAGQRLISSSGNTFLIVEEIASGGQGAVFRAFSQNHNKIVAIKLPLSASNDDRSDMLTGEARTLSRLNHPNIVKVLEHGTLTDGRPYLVTEYIKAENLHALLNRCGKLPKEQATGICLQIADAMEHAHRRGIVHGDLKPQNILVANTDGKAIATIIDFGISFVNGDAMRYSGKHIYASVLYSSPEQLSDDEISPRSDIYQLGLIFFECLLGCLPFEPNLTEAIAYRFEGQMFSYKHQTQLASAETSILKKALERNPLDRQSCMAALALQLRKLLATSGKQDFASLAQVL